MSTPLALALNGRVARVLAYADEQGCVIPTPEAIRKAEARAAAERARREEIEARIKSLDTVRAYAEEQAQLRAQMEEVEQEKFFRLIRYGGSKS